MKSLKLVKNRKFLFESHLKRIVSFISWNKQGYLHYAIALIWVKFNRKNRKERLRREFHPNHHHKSFIKNYSTGTRNQFQILLQTTIRIHLCLSLSSLYSLFRVLNIRFDLFESHSPLLPLSISLLGFLYLSVSASLLDVVIFFPYFRISFLIQFDSF